MQDASEDEVDTVECSFERIGDINGVFYYLGQQRVTRQDLNGTHAGDPSLNRAFELTPSPVMPDEFPAIGGKVVRPGPQAARRFQNPAMTGRVRVKTGPEKVMCCSKFKGRPACPEQVLERSVVGDQFWFPDGWVAFDLGDYTSLRPSRYVVRNGGGLAHDKVMTGWVLEGATWVRGEFWREGDWQILDQHHNDSSFRDLALQPAPDGSDFGYQRETAPPVKIDRNTGNATPALHPELAFTWVPSPLGQLPHHTLSFQVKPQDRSFRYLRLRQLTHAQHTHFGLPWDGHEDLYLQGLEIYGTLSVGLQQSLVPPFTPSERGMWMYGVNRQDPTAECSQWWARGAVDQSEADRTVQGYHKKFIAGLKALLVDPPPPRSHEETQQPSYDNDFDDESQSSNLDSLLLHTPF